MKNYTIVKVGSDYIVQAEEQSVLKVSSRRRAAKLVVDAAELLEHPDAESAPEADASSIVSDPIEGS